MYMSVSTVIWNSVLKGTVSSFFRNDKKIVMRYFLIFFELYEFIQISLKVSELSEKLLENFLWIWFENSKKNLISRGIYFVQLFEWDLKNLGQNRCLQLIIIHHIIFTDSNKQSLECSFDFKILIGKSIRSAERKCLLLLNLQ